MHILAVDLQNEFASAGGALYQPRPCIEFIQTTFVPFVRRRSLKIAEIISDYRIVPPATGTSNCVPGTWGYASILPSDVKQAPVWVKAETSPIWVRNGGGQAQVTPGVPYRAPLAWQEWLVATIGPPTPTEPVIVIGLMFEICVLCTLQELHYLGYRASVLLEGVDTFTGNAAQKQLLGEVLFPYWGQMIAWQQLSNEPHPAS